MEENKTEQTAEIPVRTREEILAWLDWARQMKEQRQREARQWCAERDRRKRQAMESEYYDIEWV